MGCARAKAQMYASIYGLKKRQVNGPLTTRLSVKYSREYTSFSCLGKAGHRGVKKILG